MDFCRWLDIIGVDTLLSYAPHGNFIGCGGTSEFLAYIMRKLPSDDKELLQLFFSDEYHNSAQNERIYSPKDLQDCIEDIQMRLLRDSYVRVSFMNNIIHPSLNNFNLQDLLFTILSSDHEQVIPLLFDHSFVLIQRNGIYRIESYVNQYGPQISEWSSWKDDIIDLFQDPHTVWTKLFGVICQEEYDLETINIYVGS